MKPSFVHFVLILAGWFSPPIHAQDTVTAPDSPANPLEARSQPTPWYASENLTNIATPDRDERERPRSRRRRSVDRVAVMNSLAIREGETVRDAVAVGGTADINGTVEGDLVLVLSRARLGPSADIGGDLVLVGTYLEAPEKVRVGGDTVSIGATGTGLGKKWLKWPQEWIAYGALYGRPLPPQLPWAWGVAGFSLLLYLMAALLFPKPVEESVDALVAQPGRAFLTGLLALVLFVPALLLLAVTGVGLLLVPFFLALVVVVCVFGKVAFYSYAGRQVGHQLHWSALQQPVVGLLTGAVLFCLLYTVPVLGMLVWSLALPLGIGCVLLAVIARTAKRAESTAVPVVLSSSAPETPGLPTEPLPRAGFWIRLLATLLDLVLVGSICAFLGLEKLFFLLWLAYHVGFWSWKATTLGGILIGLKIVRTSGAPINFTVALVRSLASIFSFIVLGLGFFWVGWNPEKQSWHDRITDTVIVRMPKGASLF